MADGLPLVEAKLGVPRQRTGLLDRPRIAHTLQGGDGVALTLVCAPPGYGKTTAVRAWCASRETVPAWITLDAGDNDPVRLWSYVATAVDRIRGGLGRPALQRLGFPGAPIEAAVDELTNAIAGFGADFVVVLDDLHTVTDRACLASIDHFVEHLPSHARLVAITRADPALKLGRLRSNNALAELRAAELAFTTAEAQALLVGRAGLMVDAQEIELLCARTEGWPATLVLAAIWLRTVDDPGRAVREFGGNQRFVAEYLTQEVLASLDEDARSFLLRASVLGRFTAELCDAVLGRSDSAELLARFERANLFVIRLGDGGWYRIHSLFGEFARFQLAAAEADAAAGIHRRAAEWLRSHDRPTEAAEHAAAAGEHDLVAQLLAEYHLVLIGNGGARTFLHWVRTLPDDQLLDYPILAVGGATAATIVGRSALERRRLLNLASRARAERPERYGPYVDAVARTVCASAVDGDVAQAVVEGRRAVEIAEAAADDAQVAALAGYARALYLAGRHDEAWAAALRAIEHPQAERRPPGQAFARSTLALVAAERGRLATARTHAEKARAILGGVGSSRSWLGANASAALGLVLAAEGDLAEAERELASAEHLFRDEVTTVHHVWLLLLLARVRCRRGRLDEAQATLREARAAMAELRDSGSVPSLAAEVEQELEDSTRRYAEGEVLESPSEAELAVLRLLAGDESARGIAAELHLSANTVRSHIRAIYRKLDVHTRADAVARAGTLGMLAQPQSPM